MTTSKDMIQGKIYISRATLTERAYLTSTTDNFLIILLISISYCGKLLFIATM